MTYLQLINRVLRRLREDEVTSVDENAYAKLIGDLVNEAKREVEDAWNWNVLRSTIQVTTVAGSARYTLTGSGNRFRTLHVYNQTQGGFLKKAKGAYITQLMLDSGSTQGCPYLYNYNDTDSNNDFYVDLHNTPDKEYIINFNLVIPQDDLSDGSDVLEVPSMPVILGAYSKALAERGEDQGRTHGEVANAYALALGDAIAIDNSNIAGEDTWYA